MKYRLLELLRDPVDGTRLRMINAKTQSGRPSPNLKEVRCAEFCGLKGKAISEAKVTVQDCVNCYTSEIVEGQLVSTTGNEYPIVGGIPRLLSGALAGWLKKNQETFSLEWKMFRFGERNWGQDISYRRGLFLKGMGVTPESLDGRLMLDAGCGSGALSIDLANNCGLEVVGLDLAFGIEQAYAHNTNPHVHFVQGSITEPPVKHEAVDFLYCAGVLVTIPDAKAGFRTLASTLKPGGRYFIWMYHPFDKRHHPNDHRTVALHSWVREHITSRLPISVQQALYLTLIPPYMLKRTIVNVYRAEKNRTTWREKMQDFTDDLSPMYQHRYAEEEICGWFGELGFANAMIPYQERYGFGARGDKPAPKRLPVSA